MSATAEQCWRRIGVYGGDLSCPQLAEAVHCRNCPVFHAAARTLFERPADTDDVAAFDPAEEAVVGKHGAVVFRLGSQWCGLPSTHLAELAVDVPVRRLAHRTGGRIEGLVGIRGEMHLCIALNELLALGERGGERPASARLILVRGSSGVLAFRCEQVRGLLHYDAGAIEPPPATLNPMLRRCTTGMLAEPAIGKLVLLDGVQLAALLDEALFA